MHINKNTISVMKSRQKLLNNGWRRLDTIVPESSYETIMNFKRALVQAYKILRKNKATESE